MIKEPSESRLKALETSKEEPRTLLKLATSIANVQFDVDSKTYKKPRCTDASKQNDFREQWLLRWSLKRLTDAVRGQKERNGLPQDLFPYAEYLTFLAYLLSTIAVRKSLEICQERKFANLLIEVSKPLLIASSGDADADVSQSSNSDERPRKRRRVSLESDKPGHKPLSTHSTAQSSALLQWMLVLQIWGSLLQSKTQNTPGSARTVISAWATSVQEASALIGTMLTIALCLLKADSSQHLRTTTAIVVVQWLRIWHGFSTSNNTIDRTVIGRTFNEASLKSCLDMCMVLSESKDDELVSARKEIEKQIAINTILPLQSVFNAKFAASWRKQRDILLWKDVEPVYRSVSDHLATILDTESHGDIELAILQDSRFATILVSIASRLTHKDDVRRRQKEQTWLEAVFICLAHLSFPRNMPELSQRSDGSLQAIPKDLPVRMETNEGVIDNLLGTIASEDLHFSAQVTVYIITSVLLWKMKPVSITTLSMVVNLNPLVFVPSVGKQPASSCIELLLQAISENEFISRSEYDVLVKGVIIPIMEAFAQNRDFEGLLKIWRPKLEEALRIRASASFSKDRIPSALIWDDEDVLTHFSRQCKLHRPSSIARSLLADVLQAVKALPERIGATVDVFTQLAIFQSIVKAHMDDLHGPEEFIEKVSSLQELLVIAARQQSDFQGQRWRLWSSMALLAQIAPKPNGASPLLSTAEDVCKRFHTLQSTVFSSMQQCQRTALLLEQYSIFHWLLIHYELAKTGADNSCEEVTKLLQQEISEVAKSIGNFEILETLDPSSRPSRDKNLLWDGRSNTLCEVKQLVDGRLALLLRLISADDSDNLKLSELTLPLRAALTRAVYKDHKRALRHSFGELATLHLARDLSTLHIPTDKTTTVIPEIQSAEVEMHITSDRRTVQETANNLLTEARTLALTDPELVSSLYFETISAASQQDMSMNLAVAAAIGISEVNEKDLADNADLPGVLTTILNLNNGTTEHILSEILLGLDLCALTLKVQPGVVNQASIDTLLKDLALLSSSATSITSDIVSWKGQVIFERLVGIVGALLAKHRRRLTGRSHLLLPVLQNLLKCFFYSPDRKHLYQNAAMSKQRQLFRTSLPHWLGDEALPPSAAVKFSKLISSICNPTTASARSAHRSQRQKKGPSLELSDETRKAKRLAAQYMQYLLMEYARCSLDGVVSPEVREKLTPGLYSILDAMDRELMNAMNAAMDPSSRAIFKGLYEDWTKHWKWDQN